MFIFILFLFLALAFGYFATQNTQTISVTLANQTLPNIPLYIVLGVTFLIGLIFSWIISLFGSLASALEIRGKDHKIKDAKNTIHEMTRRANQLELENATLKKQKDKGQDNTSL
jgi:uncharacterized membrane protein YciS (DUF1049 family)